MDLTWVLASSFLVVGVGYAVVHRANRFRVVCWALLCASLFALSTRDLFRTRERGPPAAAASEASNGESVNRPDDESTTGPPERPSPGESAIESGEERVVRTDDESVDRTDRSPERLDESAEEERPTGDGEGERPPVGA